MRLAAASIAVAAIGVALAVGDPLETTGAAPAFVPALTIIYSAGLDGYDALRVRRGPGWRTGELGNRG